MKRAGVAVVLAATAWGCAVIAPSPPVAPATAEAKARLILDPHPRARVPARPVLIRVRAGAGAKLFKAQLNGKPVARHFSKPRRDVRRLRASLAHGLRHGRNRLHVRVGGSSESTRFHVRRGRHLVSAGLKRRAAVGAKVFLKGRHVRPRSRHRRSAGVARTGARYRWKTIAGPTHHEAGGNTKDQPRRPHTRRPAFRPTLPGRYTLRLTVTTPNGTRASATTDVRALPPPAVPVDTMVFQKGETLSGIKVGDTFYPPDPLPNQRLPWAQVVALERDTLKPFSEEAANYTIGCDDEQGLCPEAQGELRDELKDLGPKALVIVANPAPSSGNCPSAGVAIPMGLETALSPIGVSPTGFDGQQGPGHRANCGAISAIGAPGTARGQGDWHSDISQPGGGRMQGYLLRNNERNYDFAGYNRIGFDTQAQGSSGSQNVIQVGAKAFTQSFPGGIGDGGGFQVVVLDAHTLEGDSHWFETDHADRQALIGQLRAMQGVLHDANTAGDLHRKLVLIASLGKPAIQYYERQGLTSPDADLNAAVKSVVDEVESLGGTRNGFYTMLDPALYGDHGYSYTLVSVGGSGAATGNEDLEPGISGKGTGPLNTVPMTGTLARIGPNYTFDTQTSQTSSPKSAPSAPAAGGDPTRGIADLEQIAFQQQTLWPEQDPKVFPDAGERARKRAAIKWIGQTVPDLGTDDPRSQYWTLPYTEDTWKDIAFAIQGLGYAKAKAAGVSFTEDDLEWAKAELAGPLTTPPVPGGEIRWLIRTHRYLNLLAQPLVTTSLQQWAAVNKVTNDVRTQTEVSGSTKVLATNKAWADFARELISEFLPEGAAKAASVFNDIYELASSISEINNEPVEDHFEADAGKIGTAFTDRLAGSLTTLQHQLPNTIAADYGKLKAVGSCLLKDSACPFNHADWQLTDDFSTDAPKAILPATEIWAYGALLPARYTAWSLPVWWRTSADTFSGGRALPVLPFQGIPATAQVAKPIYRQLPSYNHGLVPVRPEHRRFTDDWWRLTDNSDTWSVLPLASVSDASFPRQRTTVFPAASVTDRLFKPVAGGGLGVDAETFFARSFTPKVPQGDAWCGEQLECDDQRSSGRASRTMAAGGRG